MDIKVTRTIALNLTAKDWQIYHENEGADMVAERLNRAIEVACNTGGRNVAHEVFNRIATKYARFGLNDGEPGYVLRYILDKAFPQID